jgi:nucleotide-binding universal stress UspA family protein
MYDTILVPTDGSPGSERAIDHAVDFARTYDATLHGLYVVDDGAVPVAGAETVDDGLTSRGRRALDLVRDRATERDVPFEGELRRGDPTREILRYVETAGVDLVVMGTHGRTGIERHLLGSVTERVVRAAPVPVVTVGLDGSTDEVSSEDEARSLAREAASDRYDAVDLEPGAYRERHAWVFEGEADGRHVTVYVDRATGEAHVVVASGG